MTLKGGTSQACAACKYQRRRCLPECQLAPYFPADNPKMFQNAHRLFGVSNILKILKQVEPNQRNETMRSIIYESDIREKYPVHGCYGIVHHLIYQIQSLEKELHFTRLQILQHQQLQSHHNPTANNQNIMHPSTDEISFDHQQPGDKIILNDQLWSRQLYNNVISDSINNFTELKIIDQPQPQQQFELQFEVPSHQDDMTYKSSALHFDEQGMHPNHAIIDDGQSSFVASKGAAFECTSSDSDESLSLKHMEHRWVESGDMKHASSSLF